LPETSDTHNTARLSRAREWLILGLLLLLPLALQLARPVPRIGADAIEYYSLLHSLYFDHDLQLDNEYAHFNILNRGDKVHLTATGYRRTIFSIGPALLWLPFFALGDLIARLRGAVEDGYSPTHIRAVMLASFAYGAIGLLLVAAVLRALFDRRLVLLTIGLLLYTTSLFYYVVHEPIVSHAPSFFVGALVLWIWWGGRCQISLRRALVLGLAIGLAACVRWQNAVLLMLPAATLLQRLRSDFLRTLGRGSLVLAAFVVGTLPQMLAWQAIYGVALLPYPPHGADFLRLDHPFLLPTFFSSRHGLFYWTPILWLGYLGFIGIARRGWRDALVLFAPLAVMSYVNACAGDWWAGGSFSNRRFDSVLPLLAFGLVQSLAWLQRVVARHPLSVLGLGALLLAAWNVLLAEQYQMAALPPDDAVTFEQLAGNSARLVREEVGTPLAWPANWILALRLGVSPGQWDRMVGPYLFYRQNNLGGVIEIGAADPDADQGPLAEGWSLPRPCGDATYCRAISGRARVLVALDVPQTLDVAVRAVGSGTLSMAINGTDVAQWPLTAQLADWRVRVPADRFRRELNEVTLTIAPTDTCLIDRLVFQRVK